MPKYRGFSEGPPSPPSSKKPKSIAPPSSRDPKNESTSMVKYGVGKPPMLPPHPDSKLGQHNTLAEELVDMRAQGFTYAQIAAASGMEAAECAVMINNFLGSQYTGTSVENARQLQVRRLEKVMGILYDQVEAGDYFSQGRQTANLIQTINSVSQLLDLNKDRLRDEQIKLNQEQGQLLLTILQQVQDQVLQAMLSVLTNHSKYNPDTGQREVDNLAALRAELERDWAGWFANAADYVLSGIAGEHDDSTGASSVPSEFSRVVRGETI